MFSKSYIFIFLFRNCYYESYVVFHVRFYHQESFFFQDLGRSRLCSGNKLSFHVRFYDQLLFISICLKIWRRCRHYSGSTTAWSATSPPWRTKSPLWARRRSGWRAFTATTGTRSRQSWLRLRTVGPR